MRTIYIVLSLLLLTSFSYSQADSIDYKKRKRNVYISESIVLGGSFTGLYFLWYKDYGMEAFHFFDDSDEWLQVDKGAHAYSTYWVSNINSKIFRWAGYNNRKSVLLGTGVGMSYIAIIEVLDGFSENWGASWSDFIANTSGASLFAVQQLTWEEQRILLKYSYASSKYATYRPELLGSNLPEKLLKDYNATTFWLSFNVKSLTTISFMPDWLNIAIGYGATGMTGGKTNYYDETCNCYPVENTERIRQFYLSLDVDLTKIKTRSRFLNSVLFTLNSMKFPFPVIEFSKKGTDAHWYR